MPAFGSQCPLLQRIIAVEDETITSKPYLPALRTVASISELMSEVLCGFCQEDCNGDAKIAPAGTNAMVQRQMCLLEVLQLIINGRGMWYARLEMN